MGAIVFTWLLRPGPTADGASPFCADGTWILVLPDGRIARETVTTNRNGTLLTYSLDAVIEGDATLGGEFPDARFPQGAARGSAVRVGVDTFEFRSIGYAVNVVEGLPPEVAYIEVDEGVAVLTDCDTQDAVFTASYFLGAQDADGDGFPDDGEEPFLVVPDLQVTGKKL